ncbi:GDSL family lipase [Sphingomonas parva]|uniref:GDSL family lipase n=1 Tax=Sphingomonas parva TaxID=2555898 RepID=A0A4Y8ZYV3_9SPHN|nr:GDSL-type esterase/lipase family protein [Sphingomonas parva]TFI59856.1 GDSL family lipase [Sphingomonas parva]
MIDRRLFVRNALAAPLAAGALAGSAASAGAETWEEKWARTLREDFAMLGRYRAENEALIASKAPVDIVFLGDSITEGWRDKRPGFFVAGRIGRGIGGQTTSQMVLRMMADVVALRPKAVHIMAGTNDVAGNTGPMTRGMTQDNVRAMVAIARQFGIRPILASIPPAASFPWRPGLETRAPIRTLNAWLRDYARAERLIYIDYHRVLATADEAMRPGLAYDGVHPTEAGYDAMASVAEPVLRTILPARKIRM